MSKYSFILFKELWESMLQIKNKNKNDSKYSEKLKDKQKNLEEPEEQEENMDNAISKYGYANSYLDDTDDVEYEVDLRKYGQNKDEH